ncbi:MAG: archaellin/type IV pilin N-terminal domain-containing protein [Candidatus Hadarchaeales archaeon]
MDSKGVSPMIATIVLIAIVFAVAAILALSLASAPQPSVIFSGQLSLENVENGRTAITIKHTYGERANDVIENSGGTVKWKNLELRVNGEIIQPTASTIMISEGTKVTWGATARTYSMVVGDQIWIPLGKTLNIGDKVSLKWVPKNQTLVEKEVTY